ncbi:MAG: NADP-dependent phosphogluconate dehydrogenase [Planctomycetes bacterium]|nr:NADP-dependent phosphogluconate dehydrogenase [Planctomycetota bacterium]
MPKATCDIGLIGLAVMGQNLVLNFERNGSRVAVFNRTTSRMEEFVAGPAKGKNVEGYAEIKDFVAALKRPRRVILMVKAGDAVDAFIEKLLPLMEKGDIIIDGGNSYYKDTERRSVYLEGKGFQYVGMGVSGGEEGALWGPSMMPGGPREAYDALKPILTKSAAQVDDGACVTYVGPRGAGHYVKMVHNGIEYGDMQLICETYDIMKRGLGLSAQEMHEIFAEWNEGELKSYLVEITRDIFARVDEDTGKPLVEMVLDKAGQKGTGKWTSQDALDVGAPDPTIDMAVQARIISSYKEERVKASRILKGPAASFEGDRKQFVSDLRGALYASKICSYAQGMKLLAVAGAENNYDLDLKECARIWKGGCIIRAVFLDKIRAAYDREPKLMNLLVDPDFKSAMEERLEGWRRVILAAVKLGIPVLGMSASLAYYDSYRSETLPANLIQAQRDYFGAHTYLRTDKEGVFHSQWK